MSKFTTSPAGRPCVKNREGNLKAVSLRVPLEQLGGRQVGDARDEPRIEQNRSFLLRHFGGERGRRSTVSRDCS
jgi:hypothetical protein